MISKTQSLTVAVSGINAVDSPGPGVAILRSLKESNRNLHLLGLAYDVLEPGNFMQDLIDATYILPYPSLGPESLWERFKQIQHNRKNEQLPTIDMVIPALDAELENLILLQDKLKTIGVSVYLPTMNALKKREKKLLVETLTPAGIKVPFTWSVTDPAALKQMPEELSFPVLVKGIYYDAYIARTREEMVGFMYKIAGKWGWPILIQQFIKGEEYNVAALAQNGKMIGAVAMKKLFLTDKGKAWAGVSIENEQLINESKKIIQVTDWRGGCELEYMRQEKTGDIFLIEMNPRFPAWLYLATAAGQNLPDKLIDLTMSTSELPLEPFKQYISGKLFVRYSWDMILSIQDIDALSTRGEKK